MKQDISNNASFNARPSQPLKNAALVTVSLGVACFFLSKIIGGSEPPGGRDIAPLIITAVINCFLAIISLPLFCFIQIWNLTRRESYMFNPVMFFFDIVIPLIAYIVYAATKKSRQCREKEKAEFLGLRQVYIRPTSGVPREVLIFSILLLLLVPFKDTLSKAPSKITAGLNILRLSAQCQTETGYQLPFDRERLAVAYAGIERYDLSAAALNNLIDTELAKETPWTDRLIDYYRDFERLDKAASIPSGEWLKLTRHADLTLTGLFENCRRLGSNRTQNQREDKYGELHCLCSAVVRSYKEHKASREALEWLRRDVDLSRVLLGEKSDKYCNRLKDLAQLSQELDRKTDVTSENIQSQ